MLNADETKVAFNGPEGQFAIRTLARLVSEGGMPNLDQPAMRATFAAGKTGIHITSTSDLNKTTQMIGGKFELKTHTFPDVVSPNGRLPAGGNVVLILAKDKAKRDAAWEVVKFWTGPKGAAIMAETTGYMPPNKVANDVYLKDFYVKNPNNYTAVSQLALLTKWYAFPGDNGLKITDVIKDHLNSIITGARAKEPDAVLADMTADVQKLLPQDGRFVALTATACTIDDRCGAPRRSGCHHIKSEPAHEACPYERYPSDRARQDHRRARSPAQFRAGADRYPQMPPRCRAAGHHRRSLGLGRPRRIMNGSRRGSTSFPFRCGCASAITIGARLS